MKWTKRLKWLRISKIVIPIALAISLVFAGFTVVAHKTENFVLRINNENDVILSLSLDEDYHKNQTSQLHVPVDGKYEDATYSPVKELKYNPKGYGKNLPDDIATYSGVHSVYNARGCLSFFSFSFWLINNSSRAVDVDARFNIDSMTVGTNASDKHIDEAVRVMFIEGIDPLLSDETYMVYKKEEKSEENQKHLDEHIEYKNIFPFESDICVFNREGDMGYRNLPAGEALRFTVVVWLEGWDKECEDEIKGESLKMSIDFQGH